MNVNKREDKAKTRLPLWKFTCVDNQSFWKLHDNMQPQHTTKPNKSQGTARTKQTKRFVTSRSLPSPLSLFSSLLSLIALPLSSSLLFSSLLFSLFYLFNNHNHNQQPQPPQTPQYDHATCTHTTQRPQRETVMKRVRGDMRDGDEKRRKKEKGKEKEKRYITFTFHGISLSDVSDYITFTSHDIFGINYVIVLSNIEAIPPLFVPCLNTSVHVVSVVSLVHIVLTSGTCGTCSDVWNVWYSSACFVPSFAVCSQFG